MSRIKNTKRNILWSYCDYMITVVFQFVFRTVIAWYLGAEYLGLSSLFTSILQVLNMTELGFSSAIIYNMYKPLSENDDDTVCALLLYYRKIYMCVGIVILLIGLTIMPFLPMLIKGGWPNDINIYVLYLLFLIDTVASYFLFADKTSLLIAIQRMDLTKIAYCIINILQCIIQIVVLVLLKNYYYFIIVKILGTISKNLLNAYIAQKKFPQYSCHGELLPGIKRNIISKVKGLLIGNISGVTYTTLDSIIISSFLGLKDVAIYNNYIMIFVGVYGLVGLIRNAMQASVGNSIVSETVEKNYNDILKWQFLFSLIATWGSACLLCLYQPFMILWMGKDSLLSIIDVVLISIWFFTNVTQYAFYLYLSAAGLWLDVKWAYICSTIVNLVLNILLCNIIGITGIILASVIASVVFGAIWQCAVVFRVYFRMSFVPYFIKQVGYFAICLIIWLISYYICSIIDSFAINLIITMLLKGLICSIIVVFMYILCFAKTEVFKDCRELIINVLRVQNNDRKKQ